MFSDSGGAEAFSRFLNEELKLLISKTYRTENFSVLVGHYFGGLLAINTMLTHPHYFEAFVANYPSLCWDNAYILKLATTNRFPAKQKPFLFNSKAEVKKNGNGFDSEHPNVISHFEAWLKQKQLPYKLISYPDESHGTVSYKANIDALRILNGYFNRPQKKH